MRRSAKDLLVVAGLVLAAPLAIEVGLRAAGLGPEQPNPQFVPGSASRFSEPDETLGWRNRPGSWQSPECGNASMTFLDDGRRRSPAEPEQATESVVIFGGSYAQAYGVGDDESFIDRLNEDFEDVRFRSYGFAGAGTVQSAMLAEQVLDAAAPEERPSLVVYEVSNLARKTNVAFHSAILGLKAGNGNFLVPPHVRIQDGELVHFPASVIEAWPLAQRSSLVALLQRLWIKARFRAQEEERMEATRRVIQEFARSVEARGAQFAVAALLIKPEIWDALFPDDTVERVDCRVTWRRDGLMHPTELTVCGNGLGHPNPRVHDMWASCLGDWLRSRRASSIGAAHAASDGP